MTAFKNCRTCGELVYIPSNGEVNHDCHGMNLDEAVEKLTKLETENKALRERVVELEASQYVSETPKESSSDE